jgi:hypothetical protein
LTVRKHFRIHVAMIKWLLAVSSAYCAATGLSESRVSTLALNAGHRLPDIREGKCGIGVMTLETAIQWFSNNWPEGAEWPADVARPDPVAVDGA